MSAADADRPSDERPHPGSDDAIALGCSCARYDNNRGMFPPFPAVDDRPAGWFMTVGCPVHWPTTPPPGAYC